MSEDEELQAEEMEADIRSVPGDTTLEEEDVESVASDEEESSDETCMTPKKHSKMSRSPKILRSPRQFILLVSV